MMKTKLDAQETNSTATTTLRQAAVAAKVAPIHHHHLVGPARVTLPASACLTLPTATPNTSSFSNMTQLPSITTSTSCYRQTSAVADGNVAAPMVSLVQQQAAVASKPCAHVVARTTKTKTTTKAAKLTLSAFRRPDLSVQLTRRSGNMTSKRLEKEYDLHATGCGILGHGAFSTVRLARRRQGGEKVAIKSIAKHDALRARRLRRGGSGGRTAAAAGRSSSSSSSLDSNHHGHHHHHHHHHRHLDEWEVMEMMKDHPHVVSLLDIYETNEQIHLVTEYCNGGELFDAIQKKRNRSPTVRRGHYSEVQAACITQQLLTALRDLHRLGIVHRDLKPENICLVSDDDTNIHAKLCDFGMARVYDRQGAEGSGAGGSGGCGSNSDTETPPSTPGRKYSFCAVSCDYYAAPEVCAMGSAQKPSADVYSLGVTLYILLCGFPPVLSDDLSGKGDFVLFPGAHWNKISDCAKQFIQQMLHPDPTRRITAENALRSDWILRNDTTTINTVGSTSTTTNVFGSSSSTSLPLQRPTSTTTSSVMMRPQSSSSSSMLPISIPLQPPTSTSSGSTSKKKLSLDGNLTDNVHSQLYQALSRLQQQEKRHSSSKRNTSTTSASPTNAKRKRRELPSSSLGACNTTVRSNVKRRGSDVIVSPRRKRTRRGSMMGDYGHHQQRRSSIVCAMKELYCDVVSVSAAASAAAAGVVVCHDENNKDDVHVFVNDDDDHEDKQGELGYNHTSNDDDDDEDHPHRAAEEHSSPFKTPTTTTKYHRAPTLSI